MLGGFVKVVFRCWLILHGYLGLGLIGFTLGGRNVLLICLIESVALGF